MNEKADQQHRTRANQTDDQPGIQPIQSIALIQSGIDQGETKAPDEQTEYVGRRPLRIGRLRMDSIAQAQ